MVVDLDLAPLIGVSVTLALAVVGAWWGMAKMFVSQFERRQNERFDALQKDLDGHMTRQDGVMAEMRRLEDKLATAQVEAAMKFQTKDDAGKQFGQVIQEIRGLGSRIDALHGRYSGMPGSQ